METWGKSGPERALYLEQRPKLGADHVELCRPF